MSKRYFEWQHLRKEQLIGLPEEQKKNALIYQAVEELLQAHERLRVMDAGMTQRRSSLPPEDGD